MTARTTNMWAYGTGLDVQRSCEGYDVHATDGDIGKISESTDDTGRSSIVVDTGMWIFGKKRMIPAACVTSIDHANERVNVSLSKDQIKNAPDARDRTSRDESYYETHTGYYRPFL